MRISQGFWRVSVWSSLNWDLEVGIPSHYKWAAPEFSGVRTKNTSSEGSQYGCFGVHPHVTAV